MLKKAILTTPILIACSCLQAQTGLPKYEIGFNAGIFIYQGDLAPSALGSLKTPTPAFGLHGSRILDDYFSVRANLNVGSLKGDDSKYTSPVWRQKRNFKFNTPVTEVSAMLVYNLFGNNGQDVITRFSPYAFAGAGYTFLHIHRDWSNFDRSAFSTVHIDELSIDSAHTLPKGSFVIPLGIGAKYAITPNWAITTELTYRYTLNDYIDGFSKAANATNPDNYYSFTIGLAYTFGKKNFLKCPVFKR